MEALEQAAKTRERTKAAADKALDDLRRVTIRSINEGMTEAEAARRAGVDRMTVRKWLGKR